MAARCPVDAGGSYGFREHSKSMSSKAPSAPSSPKFAVDTSALLAMMQAAPGGSLVGVKLRHSTLSTVNFYEVLEYSQKHGIDVSSMATDLALLGMSIEPFTSDDAYAAAELINNPAAASLSMSDRACLALAQRLEVPVLTADNTWKKLQLGVEVQVLR